jgi:hypothetical protein
MTESESTTGRAESPALATVRPGASIAEPRPVHPPVPVSPENLITGVNRSTSDRGTDPDPDPPTNPDGTSNGPGGPSLGDLAPVVAGLKHLFGSMQEIQWDYLNGGTLFDGDQIVMEDAGGSADHVTMTLITPSNVTWWKDIEIYDATNALRAAAWTKDGQHQASLSIPNSLADDCVLVFKKAKLFGMHEAAYLIRDVASKAGHTLTFTWRKDG